MENENRIELPAEVAKFYKPSPKAVRVFILGLERIDLNKISLSKAEALAKRGTLVPVKEVVSNKEQKVS